MSTVARSRLFFPVILKNHHSVRLSSGVAANPPKEPLVSAASSVLEGEPATSTSPPSPGTSGTEKKSWNLLKYSVIGALTGGVATASYATYAYTLDEVDEKTKAFRASAKYTTGDDSFSFELWR